MDGDAEKTNYIIIIIVEVRRRDLQIVVKHEKLIPSTNPWHVRFAIDVGKMQIIAAIDRLNLAQPKKRNNFASLCHIPHNINSI